MKENVNNQLDKLTNKILREASVERLSFNFTDVVIFSSRSFRKL